MMIDLATPVGQLRLETGDVMDVPILSDAEYTYILGKHNNIVKESVIEALYAILARLSFETRERLDRIEFYGNQRYEQYISFVESKIKQLSGAGLMSTHLTVYASGLYKSDMNTQWSDPDISHYVSPFTPASETDLSWS